MRVLIVGCRGFVGGSIGRFAAHAGHQLLGLSRSSQPGENWHGDYVQADALHSDLSGLMRDFSPDVVLHAAGTASVGASFTAPLDDLRAAVFTWANVLDSVRRSKTQPLILFPSSAAVYGEPQRLPVAESAETKPISPYGFHKSACELLAREYATCFGLRIIVCRLFSVFGPAQKRLLIWELYQQLVSDESVVWLQGTGKESRDYLYIDDLGAALFGLIGKGMEEMVPGCRSVNVASGVETRITDAAALLRDLVSPGREIRFRGDARAGDPQRWQADVSLLRSLIPAWQPGAFPQMLAECVAAWQEEKLSATYEA